MNRVVIALGSNISPEIHIQHAIGRIQHRFGILKTSEFVWTKPDFLNGVVLIQTEMGMSELKSWLSDQEGALKRVRGDDRYGPRTIDMDIVVWNEQIVDEDIYDRPFLSHSVREVLPGIAIDETPMSHEIKR